MHDAQPEDLRARVIVVVIPNRPPSVVVGVGVASERRLCDYVARRKKRKRGGLLVQIVRRGVQPEVCVARTLGTAREFPRFLRA